MAAPGYPGTVRHVGAFFSANIKGTQVCLCKSKRGCTPGVTLYLPLMKSIWHSTPLITSILSFIHCGLNTFCDHFLPTGTANVGKSTLFNRLLESDYCKSKASYLLGKATISCWPGTTLNLLRFPIITLNKERAAMRSERLKLERQEEEDHEMKKYFSSVRLEQKAKEMFDRTAYVKGT